MYGHDIKEFNKNANNVVKEQTNVTSTGFLSRVFGYASIALLITTVVAIALGIIFNQTIFVDMNEDSLMVFYIMVISSAIGALILSFVIHSKAFRERSIIIPGIIYSVLMGVLMSTFVLFIDWIILATGFGITTLSFMLMFLIAKVTKRSFTGLGICGMALLFGTLMVSGVFGILALFLPSLGWSWMYYWIYFGINIALLVAAISLTMYDIARINTIADNGGGTNNLALYCAYIIYADFLYLLIRIIRILVMIFGNRK